jgi:plasmid stabilization system protein ParE
LYDIHRYLSEYGDSPLGKFRESFEKFCIQVSDMPYMFGQYEQNPRYRKAVIVFGYLVFYRIDDDDGTIKVYRVLRGKRNTAPLL